MNKSELISHIAEDHALSLDEATQLVSSFFGIIKESLINGNRVEIRGFGSFKAKNYTGYKGRNPKTGDAVAVGPKKLVAFRSGKGLRALIND